MKQWFSIGQEWERSIVIGRYYYSHPLWLLKELLDLDRYKRPPRSLSFQQTSEEKRTVWTILTKMNLVRENMKQYPNSIGEKWVMLWFLENLITKFSLCNDWRKLDMDNFYNWWVIFHNTISHMALSKLTVLLCVKVLYVCNMYYHINCWWSAGVVKRKDKSQKHFFERSQCIL